MHYDDVAWEKSEAIADEWVRHFLEPEIIKSVGNFLIRHHRPGEASMFSFLEKGAYNISFQMEYKNARTAVIRFPQPGATMFPEEKVCNEVAAMRYIYDQTSIPVPFVHHYASRKKSLLELGPVIIMDYIEHATSMYDSLNRPECSKEDRGALDQNISEAKLEALYSEVASILLQLSRPSLPRIGSLNQVDDFTWEVTKRPLSMPMNSLIRLGSLPQSKLPATTFTTTSSYMEALAELHISHLINQRNDAVDSAEDCRRKLAARFLFRRLAREHRLTAQWVAFDKGPFKLWCDDLRPANILLDEEGKIVGVVDWEFTYAAPVEFSFAPPWWLLIEKPEYWPQGLDDWCVEYERRLRTFLRAMRYQEDKAIKEGRLRDAQRLSAPMQDSWRSGDFWVAYAARNNFAFDLVYWHKIIDQRFFGKTSTPVDDVWQQRLDLLEPGERAEIERVVAIKVEEMKTRVLACGPDDYTKKLAEKRCKEHDIGGAEDGRDDGEDVASDELTGLPL
jgi:aminoglycoside phosphotransferase (APT) family kinase protein